MVRNLIKKVEGLRKKLIIKLEKRKERKRLIIKLEKRKS
jgi:hypothetical protein